jgi:co-chaperonin GroES (HSP10)
LPAQQFVYEYRNADPLKHRPNGDRYLIEILPVSEEKLSSGLFLPEAGEERKGWAVGVVVAVGNGHRLETPDQYIAIAEKYQCDPQVDPDVEFGDDLDTRAKKSAARQQRRMAIMQTTNIAAIGDDSMVVRYPSAVPMFFQFGEIVYVEKYSGRPLIIGGREFRIVNQVDVLSSSGRYAKLKEDGETWEERDLEQEAKDRAQVDNVRRLIENGKIKLP